MNIGVLFLAIVMCGETKMTIEETFQGLPQNSDSTPRPIYKKLTVVERSTNNAEKNDLGFGCGPSAKQPELMSSDSLDMSHIASYR